MVIDYHCLEDGTQLVFLEKFDVSMSKSYIRYCPIQKYSYKIETNMFVQSIDKK